MFNAFLHKVGAGIAGLGLAISSYFVPHVGVTPPPSPQPQVGAAIPIATARFETSLASGIASTDTSMTLVSASTTAGASISGYYCFTIDEGTTSSEFVCGTAAGTAISSMLRGIDPIDGDLEVTSLKKSHRRGASVKVTDFPVLGIVSRILNGDETLPNILQYATSSATSTIGNNIYNLAHVGYVNSVASSGVADATPTVAGKVEEATVAEINTKNSTGTDTGARLFMTPASFASSSYGLGAAFYGADTASNDTYVVSTNVSLSGYATGTTVSFKATTRNTGAATVNVNSLGAKTILRDNGDALSDGDIATSTTVTVVYDGANFRLTTPSIQSRIPVGAIEMYGASTTAPTGWLFLNGAEVATSSYPSLWSVIGYTYGGSTSTFKVPDMRGRNPLGFGSATTTFDALGETGGEDLHVQTLTELANHSHTATGAIGTGGGGSGSSFFGGGSTVANTSAVGTSTPANVLDPFIVVSFIIKY